MLWILSLRRYFNPPSPCGEGLSFGRNCWSFWHFNPPSPCGEGRTILSRSLPDGNFNPPSPCGEGRQRPPGRCRSRYFNPPSPCGEGRGYFQMPFKMYDFNPPSPCGEGPMWSRWCPARGAFQSTLPVWGGTAKVHKNSFRFHALSTNSLAFFVITSCFPGENQKTGGKFVKISVRRSQGNPGCFPLAPVYTIRVPPGS